MERPTYGVFLVASIDASLTVDAPIAIARGCDGNKNNFPSSSLLTAAATHSSVGRSPGGAFRQCFLKKRLQRLPPAGT